MRAQNQYNPIAFLGLVAEYRRTLKDGSQYDKYIPKAQGTYDIVTNNGNVHRTVQDMDKYCRVTLEDTIKLVPLLKGNSLPETLKNVFNFWYNHCQYKLDKDGVEELRRPRRAWHDGQKLSRNPKTEPQAGIDCDCFSIAVGSCLMNLRINFKFRITKYNAGWQHVYVVVPVSNDSKRYYVIDCVLNEFNEEKTYTDKFDHTMNSPKTFLGGIPLARLGEIGETTINTAQAKDDLLNGVHFNGIELGTVEEENSPMLKAIYEHLVLTRDIIRKDPGSVDIAGGATAHLKMLDHAISKWNTPEREAALDLLEQEEDRWNQLTEKNGAVNGMDGSEEIETGYASEDDKLVYGLEELGDLGELEELAGDFDDLHGEYNKFIEELQGLGNATSKKSGKTFFSNIKKAVKAVKTVNKKAGAAIKAAVKKVDTINKKVAGNIGDKAKALQEKAGTAAKKVIAKTKEVAKKAGAVIKKFLILSNPLTLAMRAGFLLAMEANLFQWAQRLLPSYFTLEEANKMGITKAAWELSKKGREAAEKVFIAIGGKASKLEKYIKKGRAKEKLSGLGIPLGEPISTAALVISAAGTLIAAASKMATAGMNNKSYAKAQREHDAAVTKQTQIKYAKARTVNGLGEADETPESTDSSSSETTTADAPKSEDTPVEAPEVTESDAKDKKSGGFKKFISAIMSFFSKKKSKGEALPDGSAIMADQQSEAADPGSAAENVEAIALQKSSEAQKAALKAGKSAAEAIEAGKQAYIEAGGGSSDIGEGGILIKAMEFIKANPIPTALGVLVVGAAITLAVSPKARQTIGIGSKPKPKAALNGLGKVAVYRKGLKIKRAKAMLPSGSHVLRVVLK